MLLFVFFAVANAAADTFVDSPCESDNDCAYKGLCYHGYCNCFGDNCPTMFWQKCDDGMGSCAEADNDTLLRTGGRGNVCHSRHGVCTCPASDRFKCHKRDLAVHVVPFPTDTPYEGERFSIACCLNMDPRGTVDEVTLLHNDTIEYKHAETPFDRGLDFAVGISEFDLEKCWYFNVTRVQIRDSGRYRCKAKPLPPLQDNIVKSNEVPVIVRGLVLKAVLVADTDADGGVIDKRNENGTVSSDEPINVMIRILRSVNSSVFYVSWETQPVDSLPVNIVVAEMKKPNVPVREYKTVYASELNVTGLAVYTWYHVTIETLKKRDNNLPARDVARIRTKPDVPGPPMPLYIRLQDPIPRAVQKCVIMWHPPKLQNGPSVHYQVEFYGRVRQRAADDQSLVADHYPLSVSDECVDLDDVPEVDLNDCIFADLWPNRDYYARIRAFNSVGYSEWVWFNKTGSCRTDFGPPSMVEAPDVHLPADALFRPDSSNNTRLRAVFGEPPDQTNGPISCYYVALVPLPAGVPLVALPRPEHVDVTDADNVIRNNLGQDDPQRFFAYVAEAVRRMPSVATLGDGDTATAVDPIDLGVLKVAGESNHCNSPFHGRYVAADPPLRPDAAYTGFLIVRVDPDPMLMMQSDAPQSDFSEFMMNEASGSQDRFRRQASLFLTGAKYAYSPYFAPVHMNAKGAAAVGGGEVPTDGEESTGSMTLVLLLSLMAVCCIASALLLLFLYRRGILRQWLCVEKTKMSERRTFSELHAKNNRDFQPILVEDLPSEYVVRHRDSDFMFGMEFNALPHYNNFDTTASDRKDNARKNRYNDIKAYDVTRVKLRPLDDGGRLQQQQLPPDADYINANFVNGYKGRKRFIAAQGPLENTVGDFWRMVWQENVQMIVMLTNLQEKYRNQCAQYWPLEGVTSTFGPLEVTAVDKPAFYTDYIVRQFDLSLNPSLCVGGRPSAVGNMDESHIYDTVASTSRRHTTDDDPAAGAVGGDADDDNASTPLKRQSPARSSSGRRSGDEMTDSVVTVRPARRRVLQYHFTNWGDYRAPECVVSLLRFVLMLRKKPPFNSSPVVVHCSAGVGRTGTLIAIDGVLDQCIEEGKADVFGLVSNLRRERNFMVQSLEQYVFVYRALAEWHTFGETDVPVERLQEHVARLNKTSDAGGKREANGVGFFTPKMSSKTPKTNMYHEYKRLERTLDDPRSSEFGKKHAAKNRYESVLPYDRNRVILPPLIGYGDASYINASHVKGYFFPYILAQDPTGPDSAFDFWRMVGENKAHCLVMLSTEDDFHPDEKYWPESAEEARTFGLNGEIEVRLVSVEEQRLYKVRRMSYTWPKDGALGGNSSVNRKLKGDRRAGGGGASDTVDSRASSSVSQREIVQFAFQGWPSAYAGGGGPCEPNTPASTGSLLELIGRALSCSARAAAANAPRPGDSASPVIVHCRDGSTKSGLYTCVSLLLERLKAEGRVDLFQTAKALQLQRPNVLASLEQYAFAYQAVLDYLEPFRPVTSGN